MAPAIAGVTALGSDLALASSVLVSLALRYHYHLALVTYWTTMALLRPVVEADLWLESMAQFYYATPRYSWPAASSWR